MLIKRDVLERIKSGEISLQFRRWKRATVKTGGSLKTVVGMLAIGDITPVPEDAVELADVQRAGFADLDAFYAWLATMKAGDLCKIEVRYAGEDPLIALRENDRLSAGELEALGKKLDGMDQRSKTGPWTRRYLALIGANPGRLAADLAASVGVEKKRFEADIAKLKALGLTISLDVGYCLSPRGKVALKSLRSADSGG